MGAVLFVLLINVFSVLTIYQPTGEDVLPGSVLLPATRRGRYLANIVRRQAVDGTGIKFNKDADRMNAESKKKVDVLSEELLPYIIAEQERRTTLYKRVMTAVQNGEKGVTIAEIRNKPPLIVRRGQLYRCPANRTPKEPDGSGTLMCEEDIEPTLVAYDSCLSAEDRELYVARNKYFFCNRHRVESPDLPRNGSSVVGCSPGERTSLNYTYRKCALEDSEDVVVHYRYYPDRTYKLVSELDPEREVCEHWSPCQIGYIYSLPAADQAVPASELWRDYEDSFKENVPQTAANYTSSARRVDIPDGYVYHQVVRSHPITGNKSPVKQASVKQDPNNTFVTVKLTFPAWAKNREKLVGDYYVELRKATRQSERKKYVKFLTLANSAAVLTPGSRVVLQGQKGGRVTIKFRATRTTLLSVMVRATDGRVYNVENTKYTYVDYTDVYGRTNQSITIDLEGIRPQDFGDYFLVVQNSDGVEERIKILELLQKDTKNEVALTRLTRSIALGEHFDNTLHYECDECSVADVLCNGHSVLSAGRVTVVPASNMISFNFPSFQDENSCVYIGFFKHKDSILEEILAVIDKVTITPKTLEAPKIGTEMQEEIPYSCASCRVDKIYVNGVELDNELSVKSNKEGVLDPYYEVKVSPTAIVIIMNEFTEAYQGVYQVIFKQPGEKITKTLMEISSGATTTTTEVPDLPKEEEVSDDGDPTPAVDETPAEPAVTKRSKDPLTTPIGTSVTPDTEPVTTESESKAAATTESEADTKPSETTASEVTSIAESTPAPQPGGDEIPAPAEESTPAPGDEVSTTEAVPPTTEVTTTGDEAARRQNSRSHKSG